MIPFEAFFLTYELLNANCLLPPRLVKAPRWRPRDLQSPASSTSSDLGVRTLLGFSVDGFGSSASQDSEVGGALFCVVLSVRFDSQYEVDSVLENENEKSTQTHRASELCCCTPCAHDERTKSKELRDVA